MVLVGEYLGNSVIVGFYGDFLFYFCNEEILFIVDCVFVDYGFFYLE